MTLRNFAYENRETPLLGNVQNRLTRASYRVAGELLAYIVENGKPYTEILTADNTMVTPTLGEQKKGDLSFMRVYKFKMVKQLTLLGYSHQDDSIVLELIALGSHENFDRNVKIIY
ncbi:type II toxin-antitoxin system RelE/ParE family toxin [Gammaproteobacteria bacterium]|nr:type II toxin-antitoxin system RelE/ParE family toxin [Gammaproteobacteria bacterium]MDA9301025.1 type II toxin-antitoxin system RelE/ParE family toxin [bacterium]